MGLGIIGGLGPMATAYLMQLIIDMTKAECDQEHLEMIIYNCPTIPDRTAYILGKSTDNPVLPIIEIGKKLEEQQVDCIAIPCITAHYFHDEIQQEITTPVIHAIAETAQTLREAGVKTVGIMATDGTIQSQIFQKQIEEAGMEVLIPEEKMQQLVMSLIYEDVKKGRKPQMTHFHQVSEDFFERGAQVIILGCTELSVIKRDHDLGNGFIDCMDVLAKKSILACGKEVKPEFDSLFEPYLER